MITATAYHLKRPIRRISVIIASTACRRPLSVANGYAADNLITRVCDVALKERQAGDLSQGTPPNTIHLKTPM